MAAARLTPEEGKRDQAPALWTMTQSTLGRALAPLGERSEGPGRLAEGVAALREALDEHDRMSSPLARAETRERLALAELAWASLVGAAEASVHLDWAQAAARAALEDYGTEDATVQRARAADALDRVRAAQARRSAGAWF